MMRTYNLVRVLNAMGPYLPITGFEPSTWLKNRENIALIDGESVAFFEKELEGVYTGHYFFSVRGREALNLATAMLKEAFTKYDIGIIRGMTPLDKLGARWMSRKLGFKGYGVVHTAVGPCELFILSKKEYMDG